MILILITFHLAFLLNPTNPIFVSITSPKNPFHLLLCTEQKSFPRSPFFRQRFTSSLSPSPTAWQTGDQLNGTEKHARTLLFTAQPSPLTDHSPASFSLLSATSSKFSLSSFSLFNFFAPLFFIQIPSDHFFFQLCTCCIIFVRFSIFINHLPHWTSAIHGV